MLRRHLLIGISSLPVLISTASKATQVGFNTPSTPITVERIKTLPSEQQAQWLAYFDRSTDLLAQDQAALMRERADLKIIPADVKYGSGDASLSLKRPPEWFGSPEALLVADNIVSFQTPAGGWGKNQARNLPKRELGQSYVTGDKPQIIVDNSKSNNKTPNWGYVGTIDNSATTSEIEFLARVYTATKNNTYRESVLKGLNYLLTAQFPNGGWPQVYPLEGGYHDCITLNDNAMAEVMQVLLNVSSDQDAFKFIPTDLKQKAQRAEQKAFKLLLDLQVVIKGRRTLWAQQYDALSLEPASARNYEPPALSTGESAGVLLYLMRRPKPQAITQEAVGMGVAVFNLLKIEGKAFAKVSDTEGKKLVDQPSASPIWARYYSIQTLKPIFGNRDKKLYDSIDDIELERRNGYAWFGNAPQKVIDSYPIWKSKL